jgi:hypothetical protein
MKKIKRTYIYPVVLTQKPFLLGIQDYLENMLQNFFESKRIYIMKKVWPIWAKTLGYKISADDREADIGALIRTAWVFLHVVTCIAIIANAIRHW